MPIERSPELEELLRSAYAAHQRGVPDGLARLVSGESASAAYGSDPDERAEGPEAAAEFMRTNAEGRAEAPPKATMDEVVAHRAGDVGWAIGWIRFPHPNGRGDALFRATAVFIREEGDWKIVQFTVSVLVPDEETLRDDWPVVAGAAKLATPPTTTES